MPLPHAVMARLHRPDLNSLIDGERQKVHMVKVKNRFLNLQRLAKKLANDQIPQEPDLKPYTIREQ